MDQDKQPSREDALSGNTPSEGSAPLDQAPGQTPDQTVSQRAATQSEHRHVQPADGFDANRPTIISLLYLASFVTGVTGLVGIVLAHMWRGEPHDAWMSSHYTYLIRTFWFGLLASIVSAVLTVVLIGFLLMPVVAIWVGVRSVMSLVKAQRHEPMPDADTLLF